MINHISVSKTTLTIAGATLRTQTVPFVKKTNNCKFVTTKIFSISRNFGTQIIKKFLKHYLKPTRGKVSTETPTHALIEEGYISHPQ